MRFLPSLLLPLMVLLAQVGLDLWATNWWLQGAGQPVAAQRYLVGSLALLTLALLGLVWSLRRGSGAGALRLSMGPWLLVLGLLVAQFGVGTLPQLGPLLELAQWRTHASGLSLEPQGRSLVLRGRLGPGDATRVRQTLKDRSALVWLDLDLQGAVTAEALDLAQGVRDLGLSTRVRGRCDEACALVFLAGRSRQVLGTGRLGLQRNPGVSVNPLWRARLREQQQRLYRAAGLPEVQVVKMMLTPAPAFWHPDRSELADLQTRPEHPLDTELPPRPGTQREEYEQAFNSHPVWQTLEARLPGLQAQAATRAQAAHGRGDQAAWLAAQTQALQGGLNPLLRTASHALRMQYLELLAEALLGLEQDAECRALLAGEAGLRRRLKADWVQREVQWLVDASQEQADAVDARPLQGLEQEVLSRAVGGAALQTLPGLWTAGRRGPALGCADARALLDQVLKLAPPQRRLAVKRIFLS